MYSTETLAQRRKANKPLTERRRRERINNSLQQMKTLVLRATNKQDNVKLEKADIMEMTVRYLQDLQQKQCSEDRDKRQLVINSYTQGYTACLNEVSTILSTPVLSDNVRSFVSNNLATSFYGMTARFHHDSPASTKEPSRPLSRVSNVSEDRLATSTPYSFLNSDDGSTHNQLSPIFGGYAPDSLSPSTNHHHIDWSSTYSTSPQYHSATDYSVHSDSGANSSGDSTVWRPW